MWTPPSRLLAARIPGQFGLVTRSQALGAGVTRKAIARHLDSGRWVVVHPGVYLTTPGRSGWSVRAMSALLWSAAEVRYVRDVERAHGLPAGRRQGLARDCRRRDIEYEDFGLVVEIDGRLGHVGWANQPRDGRRDREAAADAECPRVLAGSRSALRPRRRSRNDLEDARVDRPSAAVRARLWPT